MHSQIGSGFGRLPISRSILIIAVWIICITVANAQMNVCPPVGADTTCGVIIVINDTGPPQVITSASQGPYDGDDDTLVGIINASSIPITSIKLSSALPIFAFDGDGIDTYGVQGNSMDNTGYGGPNSYFTAPSPDNTSGTVNFIVPLAPRVGNTYFSLENAIKSAVACPDYLNNGLKTPTTTGADINASFTPVVPIPTLPSLATAAQVCGFSRFEWQQTVVNLPSPSPYRQNVKGAGKTLVAPPIFLDPPFGGYFGYGFATAQYFPFYPKQITNNGGTINFFDSPGDSCLYGGDGNALCGYAPNGKPKTAPKGAKIAFKTRLVGVLPAFTGSSSNNCTSDGTCIDLGIGFDWTSDNNHNAGGATVGGVYPVLTAMTSTPLGPGSKGALITAVYSTTTYNGIGVTAVNGSAPGIYPNLTKGRECNGAFGGNFVGDIYVAKDQSCTLNNATVTGSIRVEGGTLAIMGTSISEDVTVEGGTVNVSAYSAVNGSFHLKRTPALSVSSICNSTLYGSLTLEDNEGSIAIGGKAGSACTGNVVGRELQIIGDRGAITVENNVVTDELECYWNRSISGSGNTADEKRGECRAF